MPEILGPDQRPAPVVGEHAAQPGGQLRHIVQRVKLAGVVVAAPIGLIESVGHLLSPDALPLDQKNKEKLEKVMGDDPLALIEYWSVDPDYDGEIFKSKWQDYRQNTENDGDEFRVIKKAKLEVPKVKRKRKVCVKAVDVFGFESVAVQEIK